MKIYIITKNTKSKGKMQSIWYVAHLWYVHTTSNLVSSHIIVWVAKQHTTSWRFNGGATTRNSILSIVRT